MARNYFRGTEHPTKDELVFFDDRNLVSITEAWEAIGKKGAVFAPYPQGPGYGCDVIGISQVGPEPAGEGAYEMQLFGKREQLRRSCWQRQSSHVERGES